MATYFVTYVFLLFSSVILLPGGIIFGRKATPALYRTNGFRWNVPTLIVVGLIGVVAGSRGVEIGTDYRGYYEFYDYILNYGEFWHVSLIGNEIGWQQLNLWAGQLGVPAGVFFGAVTAATWLFFIKGSYRYQYLLPLMMFFAISTGYMYWTWSGLRQSIAIMIFFFSIRYIIERRPVHFLAVNAIGALFHLSVLVALPAYFVRLVPYRKLPALAIYCSSLAFVGLLNLEAISEAGRSLLSQIPLLEPYLRMLGQEKFQQAREVTGTNLGFVLKSAFTIWIIMQSDKIINSSRDFEPYIVFYVLYATLSNIFFAVELVGRATTYFLVCFPIVAAATIRVSTSSIGRRVGSAFLAAFFALFLVTTYRLLAGALS